MTTDDTNQKVALLTDISRCLFVGEVFPNDLVLEVESASLTVLTENAIWKT